MNATPDDLGGFVHLNVHSDYSIADGMLRIGDLIEAARQGGHRAVGVTDRMNLFAIVKFYNAAMAAGIKPVCGIDAEIREGERRHWASLLIRNHDGYIALSELLTQAYLEDSGGENCCIDYQALVRRSDSLIVLMGRHSDFDRILRIKDPAQQALQAEQLKADWGDALYVQLCRSGTSEDETFNRAALSLARRTGIPVCASMRVRFLREDDYQTHEARVCIAQNTTLDDPNRVSEYRPSQHFAPIQQMRELFADIPEALANTVEIAKRCTLELPLGEVHLPVLGEDADIVKQLREHSEQGLRRHLAEADVPEDQQKVYFERLDMELGVISRTGYAGYFLVVEDFVKWARNQDIPVGPGRGSGVSSVVAWSLDITAIDPIEHNLLFERFLNPDRISMPDFDIDICPLGRERVLDYVADRYGREKVAQIVTFTRLQARAAVQGAGQALGSPKRHRDNLAAYIPNELGISLARAFEDSEALREVIKKENGYLEMWELALNLEGLVRDVSKHAAGVVIAPDAVSRFTPLYRIKRGESLVTQSDKDDLERMGLVKFDFLGLKNLTLIQWALDSINEGQAKSGKKRLTAAGIPIKNAKTYQLLRKARTMGVFQLESPGVQELLRQLKPTEFSDIVAIMGLYRPGALNMNMHTEYADRKNGRSEVDYDHPNLEPILRETYGVFVYQEQIMQGAQIMGGFTLAEADTLRRAMGKKDAKLMDQMGERFRSQAGAHGLSDQAAAKLFEKWKTFSEYGFNKSHAVAYGLICYQTAWLKANHPEHFFAAAMSCSAYNKEKPETILRFYHDCRQGGIEVRPPCINESGALFRPVAPGVISYGLSAIKGIGNHLADALCRERQEHGPFKDMRDLYSRTQSSGLTRQSLELLISCGALDCFKGWNRASLMAAVKVVCQAVDQDRGSVQHDMLGGGVSAVRSMDGRAQREYPRLTMLEMKRQALGFHLGEHPLDFYREVLNKYRFAGFDYARRRGAGQENEVLLLAGIIIDLFSVSMWGSGGSALRIVFDDGHTLLLPNALESNIQRTLRDLGKGALVAIQAVRTNQGIAVKRAELLDEYVNRRIRGAEIVLEDAEDLSWLEPLRHLDTSGRGGFACTVVLNQPGGEPVRMSPPKLRMDYQISREIAPQLGSAKLRLVYDDESPSARP